MGLPQRRRQVMKKVIVTPIQNRPLLHSQPTSVPFIGARIVRVLLLHLQRLLEELPPRLPRPLHQLVAHTMVHHLEEPPLPTGARDQLQRGLAHALVVSGQGLHVNDWDVDGGIVNIGRSFGRGLDVVLRDCCHPTLGEGLDSNNRLRPALHTLHHRSKQRKKERTR